MLSLLLCLFALVAGIVAVIRRDALWGGLGIIALALIPLIGHFSLF